MTVCVKNSKSPNICISGIVKINELSFHDGLISAISFSLKLIHGLGFRDDFNFMKNLRNRSCCRKFQAIELNSSL